MPLTKLELTRIGKHNELKLEPRILIPRPDLSGGDESENMLIHGDNLLALKALEQDFAGKIKCIYIDPPYNTGSAFEFYEDNIEHSIRLNLMHERLRLLRSLLSEDGFLCCHIDDSEGHYLKVLLDEVMGRDNYLTTYYIRVRYPDKTLKQDMNFHKEIEQIHVYKKSNESKPNLPRVIQDFEKYNYYIEEKVKGRKILLGGKKVEVFSKGEYQISTAGGSEFGLKEIRATGTILDGNSSGRFFRDYLTGRFNEDGYGSLYKVYGIGDDRYSFRYFTGPNRIGATKGKYYQGVPMEQINSKSLTRTAPINNFYDLAGSFGNCRGEGGVDFRSGKKPEILLRIIMTHFSNEGDWVLDSFLGSGSTAAVAQKMQRKWIGIEIGNHAYTHAKIRLDNVVSGDQTGISEAVSWQGGGGYTFYELGPSLLHQDDHGNYIINPDLDGNLLIQALCKVENFHYRFDNDGIKHGQSSEKDFLHVTTRHINQIIIDELVEKHIGSDEGLLILTRTFDSNLELPDNIQIKKIPKAIIRKCEYGKDDYSLPVTERNDEENDESLAIAA